jgi:hypothetical protein
MGGSLFNCCTWVPFQMLDTPKGISLLLNFCAFIDLLNIILRKCIDFDLNMIYNTLYFYSNLRIISI